MRQRVIEQSAIAEEKADRLLQRLQHAAERHDAGATAFVAVPSLMFGVGEVLVPLRIDNLDGSYAVIAGAFIVAAGIEATASNGSPAGAATSAFERSSASEPPRVLVCAELELALPSVASAAATTTIMRLIA